MPNMVIPNTGKAYILDFLFANAAPEEDFVVDVFVNNVTVGDSSTVGTFTIGSWTGYAQADLFRTDFDPATVVSNVGEIDYTVPPEFECTGGSAQTAYGWILRGATTGTLIAGQNFTTPVSMSPGATLTLTPFKIKCKTLV